MIFSVSIAAMLLVVTFQYAHGLSFGSKVQLSSTNEMSIDPAVGTENRYVYVLWNDGCFIDENDNTVCNDISFRRSADSGTTFDDTIHLRIDNDKGQSGSQTLTQSKQNVYASWVDGSEGNDEIFFAASNNRGESFNEATNLSENEGNSGIEPASMAASGQDSVYVTWTDDTPGNTDILFRASHDGGNSFGDTMNLSKSGGQSFIPLMAAFEETVYVAWFEVSGPCNNLLVISTNGGESFGEPICIDDFGVSSVIKVAAVSDEKVYLAGFGQVEGVSDVLLMRSTDGGENFKVVSLEAGFSINFEKVAISGNRVLFAWQDPQSGDELLKVSTDGGRTFGPTINITDDGIAGAFSGQSMEMVLAAKKAYFVWSDSSTGNLEVYFGASETTK